MERVMMNEKAEQELLYKEWRTGFLVGAHTPWCEVWNKIAFWKRKR